MEDEPKEPRLIGELLAFLDSLPAGFANGPREQMAVRELVLRLIDAGEMPADAARLKTLIAPLVCGDPGQQQEFYDRFGEWVSPKRAVVIPERKKSRRWPAVAAAVLVAAGVVGGRMYYKSLFRAIPGLSMPQVPSPPCDGCDSKPEPKVRDRFRGIVQSSDGQLRIRGATVWIPFGIDTPQYPKVVTDARGSFSIEMAAKRDNFVQSTPNSRVAPLVLQPDKVTVSVAFSPDGSKVATTSGDNIASARIWDASTGKEILFCKGPSKRQVAFSPDGRLLTSIADDKSGTVTICDTSTGQEVSTFSVGQNWGSMAFSPDGRTLASGNYDGTVRIWDRSTGKELLTLRGHTGEVRLLVFSPDGTRLATSGRDQTAKVWEAATGKELLTFRGHTDSVNAVAFSPDGTRLATGSADFTAKIWDANTGEAVLTIRGLPGHVWGVAFSPDGSKLATGAAGGDHTARIWDAGTGKELLALPDNRETDSVAFSPDGRKLATASVGARIWDLAAMLGSNIGSDAAPRTLPPGGLNLLVTHPDFEPAYVEHVGAGPSNVIKLGPLKAAARVLRLVQRTPPVLRRYPMWASATMALLPLAACLLAFWRQRKRDQERKAFLDQWETHLDFEPVRIHTRSEEDELFQGIPVATLARELRRRRPEPTSQLAVEATAKRTAAHAGLFSPVRLQRRGSREYLVLLESTGGRDQQARLWSCLLDRLAARDVWLDRYSFSGDPRVCETPGEERGWLRLDEIAALHPRHELWMVSGAGRFFDSITRQPAPWIPALSRWPERAVVTLTAGTAEDCEQLANLGFAVATASVAGLAEINTETGPAPKLEPAESYPLLLEEDETRWLQGPAPEGEPGARELRSLDRQLRAWLGGDGYRCLIACAVYPGLAWNLTLHMALALIPAEERESTLARLVRLPWFRHGRMPQWLREFFAGKLDREEAARTSSLLRDFLNRKAQPEACPAAGLEFVKRISADLAVGGKPPTRDYVFLSFLLGRKPRLQDLEAPAWLRQLLYPEGLPVLGWRREWWLVLGLLAAGLVFKGAEWLAHPPTKPLPPEWHEIKPPAALAGQPPSALSAHAMEIAASRLGQSVDGDFVSAHFDKAAQFATARGEPKPGSARPGAIFTPRAAGGVPSLVEQVVEDGLILIEPFEGRLRRVFRRTDELAGGFSEIAEEQRSKINPKDGLLYVWIPPGEFWMGATPGDTDAQSDEEPRHRVRITKGFWLGETPVTVAAYKRLASARPGFKMPDAPSFNPNWSKPDHPVVRVTWDEAKAYCESAGGRLPTEAEWEYAARGGKDGLKYPWGNKITPENANYLGSRWNGTSPVRSYPANAWGLYDMAGNVWEWLADWYGQGYYRSLPPDKTLDGPRGPASGMVRVLRGGSFYGVSRSLRAAVRFRLVPDYRTVNFGFRCVREVVP